MRVVSRVCVYSQRHVDYSGTTVEEYRVEMGPALDAGQKLDRVTDGKLLSRYICLLCTNICTKKWSKFKITPTCFGVNAPSAETSQVLLGEVRNH